MNTPDEASPDWCHSCLKLEPLPAEYHEVCGECGHVYVTAEDLMAAYIEEWRKMAVSVQALDTPSIDACPLCGHDF